jgi:hypothetical protein
MNDSLNEQQLADLSAWIDGELDIEQSSQIARRVRREPAWNKAFNDLTRLDDAMDAWTAPPAPDDLADRILQRVREPEKPHHHIIRRLSTFAAAAALILGVFLYVQQLTNGPSPSAPTPARSYPAATAQMVPDELVRDGLGLFSRVDSRLTPQAHLSEVVNLASPQPSVEGDEKRVIVWQQMTPQQKDRARRQAEQFLSLPYYQQQMILAEYEHARAMRRKQQIAWEVRWLKAVVDSLSPTDIEQLKDMTPHQRGRLFIQRRNELIRTGQLQPPSAPQPR